MQATNRQQSQLIWIFVGHLKWLQRKLNIRNKYNTNQRKQTQWGMKHYRTDALLITISNALHIYHSICLQIVTLTDHSDMSENRTVKLLLYKQNNITKFLIVGFPPQISAAIFSIFGAQGLALKSFWRRRLRFVDSRRRTSSRKLHVAAGSRSTHAHSNSGSSRQVHAVAGQ